MTRWLTADTHFFHENIIKYCVRPFASVDEMDRTMEERWNARIGVDDEVYCLGDFASWKPREYEGKIEQLFRRLHGKKYLIRGGHDKRSTLDLPWGAVHDRLRLDGVILIHDPPYDQTKGTVFCGHIHDAWKRRGNLLNLGVDVWHFYPVEWQQALDYWTYHYEYWRSHYSAKTP